MGDYLGDLYPYAKFHHDTITPLRPPPPQICENAHQVTRLVSWFFGQPTAKTPGPIFTINTSNDAVSRNDVPFGGPENKILHFDPIFPKKRKFLAKFRRDWKFRVKKALKAKSSVSFFITVKEL